MSSWGVVTCQFTILHMVFWGSFGPWPSRDVFCTQDDISYHTFTISKICEHWTSNEAYNTINQTIYHIWYQQEDTFWQAELTHITHFRRDRQCHILACIRCLRVAVGDVLGRLAHIMLKDTQAFSQTAECGCRRGFEQEQVLIQGGQRPAARQGLDGIHQILLLALRLGHDLKSQVNRDFSSIPFGLQKHLN